MARVTPGQSLRISARDWNQMAEAAAASRASRFGGAGPISNSTPMSPSELWIHNTTDDDLPIGSVLSIEGPKYDDPDTAGFWEGCLDGKLCDSDEPTSDKSMVVLLEPIPKGFVGRAAAAGIARTLVKVNDQNHKSVIPVKDQPHFETAEEGYPLLWVGSPTQTTTPQIGLVRLDGGGGAAPGNWLAEITGLIVSTATSWTIGCRDYLPPLDPELPTPPPSPSYSVLLPMALIPHFAIKTAFIAGAGNLTYTYNSTNRWLRTVAATGVYPFEENQLVGPPYITGEIIEVSPQIPKPMMDWYISLNPTQNPQFHPRGIDANSLGRTWVGQGAMIDYDPEESGS